MLYTLIIVCCFSATCVAMIGIDDDQQQHQQYPEHELKRLKRSDWNKAIGLWGKRSPYYSNLRDLALIKRPENQWGKLNSLWGKRSSWDSATGLWGKRSFEETTLHDYEK